MEAALVTWLRSRLPPHPRVAIGVGDDAAVLRGCGGDELVLTVDMLTDHVDFELGSVEPHRIGRKALAVNLSDLAAMAARPLAAVVAVVLPRGSGLTLAQALYEGMMPLAAEFDAPIVGGDTNSWDGPLALSVTLLGTLAARCPLRRDGARPGDRLLATGAFGGSILGRHFDFVPRIAEAAALHRGYELHAGLDVSDGLSLDAWRLAAESGCGVVLDLPAIPVHDDARRLAAQAGDDRTPLEHALGDGEDFELLLAVPRGEAERLLRERPLAVPLTDIGEFVPEPGLWRRDAAGTTMPLPPRGWVHAF